MRDSGLDTISDAAEPSIARRTPSHSPRVDRENPDSTDAASNRSASAAPRSRWRRPLLILGPVVLVVGALALYLATGRYVTEEDAYVQAVNVSISPQVAGQVVAIAARSNIAVKKYDPLFNLDPEPYRIALANAEAQLGVARDQAHTLFFLAAYYFTALVSAAGRALGASSHPPCRTRPLPSAKPLWHAKPSQGRWILPPTIRAHCRT
jgi:membrane fusion protein, multidrug efflux system